MPYRKRASRACKIVTLRWPVPWGRERKVRVIACCVFIKVTEGDICTPVFVYQSEEIKRRLKTASVMQQDCSQYTVLRRKKIGKSKLKICPTQFFFSHECNVEISYYIFRLYVRNINSEIPRLSSPERSPPRSVCPSVVRFVSHPTSSNAIEDFHPI